MNIRINAGGVMTAENKENKIAQLVAKWQGKLEEVKPEPPLPTAAEARAYKFAVRRNIARVFAHYAPGVKLRMRQGDSPSVSYCLEWTDGPAVDEVESWPELQAFLRYEAVEEGPGIWSDHKRNNAAWRERYGELRCLQYDLHRTLSPAVEDAAKALVRQSVSECIESVGDNDYVQVNVADMLRLADSVNSPYIRQAVARGEGSAPMCYFLHLHLYGEMLPKFRELVRFAAAHCRLPLAAKKAAL